MVAVVALGAFGAFAAYGYFRAGNHTLPEMPKGSFPISFKNGFRAILVDVPNERATRRYFGYPLDVPFYIEDAWSFCSPPNNEESADVEQFMSQRNFPGERFEVICRIQVDDETVVRGLITTVPKL